MSRFDKKQVKERHVEPLGDQQIALSKGNIEELKREADDVVTQIRSSTDAEENKRRIEEERQRDERYDKIQTEVLTSHKKNIKIDLTWHDLDEKEDCEQLFKEMEKQKEACLEIIKAKELLIDQFKKDISDKVRKQQRQEKHYAKALQKQAANIEDLIMRMRTKFHQLRREYSHELKQIEAAFMEERDQILISNNDEIKELFNKQKQAEEAAMQSRYELEENHILELENIRTKDANSSAEQKIRLETEMQILEKAMEDMRAVYQLNEEKLDFNLRVLKERQKVNTTMLSMLKNKIRKNREGLGRQIEQYNTENLRFKNANVKLTEDYKRITQQFKELQKKFRHFEKSDNARFNEIWAMNEAEVRALIAKIIQADKVIHVQQLGIPWTPPTDPIFGLAETGAGSSQLGPSGQAGINTSAVDSSKHGISKSEFVDDQSMVTGQQHTNKGEESRISIEKIKNVFHLLIMEAQFLIDDKTHEQCASNQISDNAAFKMKVDAIRKTLGIDSMEDIELLVDTFYQFDKKPRGVNETMEEEDPDVSRTKDFHEADSKHQSASGIPQQRHSEIGSSSPGENSIVGGGDERLDVDEDEIFNILDEFNRRRQENLNKTDLLGNPRMKKHSNVETEAQRKERIKREERMFWERMTTVLSEGKQQTWKNLDEGLSKYYKLLVERQNLIEETGLLNQQNEELKTLLNQYLQAGVNHDLKVPPTQVIRLDA